MALPQMTCQKCAITFTPPTKNTRYCVVCRVHRDLHFLGDNFVRNCTSCDASFYPIRSSHYLCSACTFLRGTGSHECKLCGQKNQLAPGLSHTCIFCVTSSKKFRAGYRLTIDKIIAERINEQNKTA